MKSLKVVKRLTVPLDSIITGTFDARVMAGACDEERVRLFKGLYADGKLAHEIEVREHKDGSLELIDGRTRYAALIENGTKKATVGVLEQASEAEYRAHAYTANCVGSKQPNIDDLRHVIEQLFDAGWEQKQIHEALIGAESTERIKQETNEVRSRMMARRMSLAKREVLSSNLPVDQAICAAAEKHRVKPSALKKAMQGNLPGKKRTTLLKQFKKDFGSRYRAQHQYLYLWMNRLEQHRSEGITPTEQLFEVYKHLISCEERHIAFLKEGKRRLEMRVNGGQSKVK